MTRIIIERREYRLPADQSLEAIMATITELVRAGGGFVELLGTPRRAVNVLVSPGTSLSIEVADVEDPEPRPVPAEAERWETSALDPFEMI